MATSTGTLSSAGIGSGLNVTSLVSQLMATQQQPLLNLQTQQATYQAEISAYGSLAGTLSTLQTDATNLSSSNLYSAYSATASASGFFTSSANATASAGSYGLAITNLAQANKLASNTHSATTSTTVGSGNITFQFGTTTAGIFSPSATQPAQTLTIDSAHNSLAGISAAINSANVGVTASIANDGSGYRLVLTSNNSGAANSLKVSVSDTAGSPAGTSTSLATALTYDPNTAGVHNMTQTVAGKDAVFTLDGMAMTSASNTVTNAIQGVSLTLTQPTTTPLTLTVAANTTLIQSAVQSFVTDYNAAQASIKSLTAYNATTKTAAILTGDSTVMSVQTQLRAILNTPLSTAGGGLNNLADVGITFNKDGTLALNSATLSSVLADPTKNIATLFASVGVPSDPLVKFGTATTAAKGGNYAVNISQMATQGTLTGSAAPVTTTIASGSNDQFNINVNGIAAAITIPAGSYSSTTLAAQVQSQINGAAALSAAGITVSVGYDGSGNMLITSNQYGSASTVTASAAGSNGGFANLFGAPVSAAGLDVAGTIGGASAHGIGQTLTATTGNPAGLTLNITGGATGARGTVAYAAGIGSQLASLLGNMTSISGMIANRTSNLQTRISNIGTKTTQENARLAAIQAQYQKQFSSLDKVMASMSQTSTFLTQQITSLQNNPIVIK